MLKKLAITLARCSIWLLLVIAWTWSLGAAWHYTIAPIWMRLILAAFLLAIPLLISYRTRNAKYVAATIAGIVCAMACLWQWQLPSNDRAWKDDLKSPPRIAVESESIVIHNFLPFEGATTQQFELGELRRVWFGVEKFAGFESGAHNFLTFEFNDGKFLSVSVEARKERGEEFTLLPALFRQFELIYLMGDEAYILGSRSDFSAPTFLYPLKANPKQQERLLLDICERANALADRPEWYNILTNNCTNNLSWHATRISDYDISPYDLRVILSGQADRLLHRLGLIDLSEALDEIHDRCQVDAIAREVEVDSRFSTRIRRNLLNLEPANVE